ncbi:MAG: TetR family transcriptional regulator C-terminal domain-containing protein [Bacillota bacterium]|nr:TetR family transcriptional regulator C-terminal domain-containing protein [Bacillota bacterium]
MDNKYLKKNEILKKTIGIMHQKGFNGTGVQEVVQAAGIPKGSFYNYFDSKEDYAIQALQFFFSGIKENSLKILKDGGIEPAERIKTFYANNIKAFENNNFKFGCLIGNLTEEMGDISNNIAKNTEDIHQEIADAICLCLDEISNKDDKVASINNMMLANFIVNSWQGAMLRMKSSKNSEPLKAFYSVISELLSNQKEEK